MSGHVMLNIGCGSTHHPDWVNLDVSPSVHSILPVDIGKGLPFPSGTIAVCYSSHVLEHLDREAARNFLTECLRVLNHHGVIRIVVPDLEGIVREYLRILDGLLTGDQARENDYDWIMLELYDQVVRNVSGGEMTAWLNRGNLQNEEYIVGRCGMEVKKIIERAHMAKSIDNSCLKAAPMERCRNLYSRIRELLLRMILRGEYKALQIGRFRIGGEVHQWMYDQFSLSRLLLQNGFTDIKRCTAFESRIPNFDKYGLDVLNGEIRKPDSIFIEAIKP